MDGAKLFTVSNGVRFFEFAFLSPPKASSGSLSSALRRTGEEGKKRWREMRIRVDKREEKSESWIGKRGKSRAEREKEKEREVENERGSGAISDLVYVLYEKRAKRGGGLAVVGCATPAMALPK